MSDVYQPLGIGVGTIVQKRYELLKKLGSGAFSAVYKVYDRALKNDTIALKLFSPSMMADESAVERVYHEALITRKLNHPNIVRAYDIGRTSDGQLYLTMEFVEGTSLERLIHGPELHRPTFTQTVQILIEIATGLAYAHSEGVVHRDVKPANILVSPNGRVKIADFGLSRTTYLRPELTQAGECVGTPYYMAPEQIQSLTIDGRCDIYALGIIAFEMIVGRVPFHDPTWFNLAKQIIEQPIPDLSKSVAAPDWFWEFIRKAAAKKPSERFQSADEVVTLLQEQLSRGLTELATRSDGMLPKVFSFAGLKRSTFAITGTVVAPASKISNTKLFIVGTVFTLIVLTGSFIANKTAEVNEQIGSSTEILGAAGSFIQQVKEGAEFAREHKDELKSAFDQVSVLINQTKELSKLQGDNSSGTMLELLPKMVVVNPPNEHLKNDNSAMLASLQAQLSQLHNLSTELKVSPLAKKADAKKIMEYVNELEKLTDSKALGADEASDPQALRRKLERIAEIQKGLQQLMSSQGLVAEVGAAPKQQ